MDGLTSSTVTSINVANGTAVTTSGNEQVNTGGPAYLFSNSGVSQFGNMSVAAVIVLNATPNSTKLGNWHSFCQSFFVTT